MVTLSDLSAAVYTPNWYVQSGFVWAHTGGMGCCGTHCEQLAPGRQLTPTPSSCHVCRLDYASKPQQLGADLVLACAVVAALRLCPATALGATTMQHARMHTLGSPAKGVIHQAICHSCKGLCQT